MSKHIDYEVEAKFRTWWLNNTGGDAKDNLTVRDYFAAKAMQALISDERYEHVELSEWAYRVADEMMKQRALDKQGEL